MTTNYYELLEISPAASEHDVRKAIRDQRKRWSQLQGHPKLEVQHEAQLKVRELTEAETVLTDPGRRREYDSRIRPPGPAPTVDRSPNPTPVFDRQPPPDPRPWQPNPTPWAPKPPREPRISSRTRNRLVVAGLAVAAIAAAIAFVAPALGNAIRRSTGHFPAMAVESYDGSFDSIVRSTDRLVGASLVGAVSVVLLSLVLLRWKKAVAMLVLALGLTACGGLGITSASAFSNEARELVMDSMCNGGTGSTGRTTLDGREVNFGLNRSCDALVLWTGTEEIRTMQSPASEELELHVVGTTSRAGGYYVAAATMAPEQGGQYTLVIFRLDEDDATQSFELRAPNRGQGFPILGERGRFQFEQQTGGEGMVTAVDPDTGDFVWNATCQPEWEYLQFGDDSDYNPPGPKIAISCVQPDADRYRRYAVDEETGDLGELVEDREW